MGSGQERESEVTQADILTIWQPGEEFQPVAVDNALRALHREIAHPSFGDGYSWGLLAPRGAATHLDFFPANGLVRLRIPTAPGEYESRHYNARKLIRGKSSRGAFLAILSERANRYSVLKIFSTGATEESSAPVGVDHGLPEPVPTSNNGVPHEMVTLPEAARIIGCRPENVRKLIRHKRLPAVKRGSRWLLRLDAVMQYRPTRIHK